MGESLPSRRANRNGDLHGFADFNWRFWVQSGGPKSRWASSRLSWPRPAAPIWPPPPSAATTPKATMPRPPPAHRGRMGIRLRRLAARRLHRPRGPWPAAGGGVAVGREAQARHPTHLNMYDAGKRPGVCPAQRLGVCRAWEEAISLSVQLPMPDWPNRSIAGWHLTGKPCPTGLHRKFRSAASNRVCGPRHAA